jgi:RimJ/RimL family protein N-acetyltransferase
VTPAITLRDGTHVHVRPIRPDDEPRLVDLYSRLSRDTRYHRFFTVMQRLPPDWAHFLANVDYQRRFAFVVEEPGAQALIAVGRYELSKDEPGIAELAVVVQDGWQGKGIGRVLMDRLLREATSHGITRFRAYVLAENRRMLQLLRRSTSIVEQHTERGVVDLLVTAKPPEETAAPLTQ